MEILVGGLVVSQLFGSYFTYRYHRSMLNAIVAKTPQEFVKLEQVPRRKTRRPDPAQDDAGIPFGL